MLKHIKNLACSLFVFGWVARCERDDGICYGGFPVYVEGEFMCILADG
jgi:hypothetical protein